MYHIDYRYRFALVCVLFFSTVVHSAPWSWGYKGGALTDALIQKHSKTDEGGMQYITLSSHKDTHPFSQLIFSWNAVRPAAGHFSFWAQVRNRVTGTWSKWYKMVDWGAGVQKSYASPGGESSEFANFHHVRLEVDPKVLADGFRIRMGVHEGADPLLLHAHSVNIANFSLFAPENIALLPSTMQSVHIPGVPAKAQLSLNHSQSYRLCSPTSCAMLIHYLTGSPADPVHVADSVFDTGLDAYGSWPFNTAHVFERCGGSTYFFVARLNSFSELYGQLARGIPIIVSVRGSIEGAPKDYPHGHLLIVVGFDKNTQTVLCHDPAVHSPDKVYKKYPLKSFIRAWENSKRLVYWVEQE